MCKGTETGVLPVRKEGNENMKVLTSGVVVCAMISILAIGAPTVARATPSAIDFKTVTSKAYVDSLIGDVSWDSLSWVVNNDGGANRTNAINVYNTTFGNGANQWAGTGADLINGQFLANSLALKQNKIDAGTAGNVVTYSGTAGQFGTPLGVLTSLAGEDSDAIENYSTTFDTSSTHTDGNWLQSSNGKLITTNVLATGLELKQNQLQRAFTSTTSSYVMASMGGQTIDLTTTPGKVGRRYITAGGSQPLTQKSGADNVILYINGTKTLAQYQTSNFGATSGDQLTTNQNYIKGALVSLELLKDVYGALHTEITTKQDVLTARAQNAPVTIPTYPAYGQTDGTLGQMLLDTTTLYTTDDSHFPSSKLLNTKLGLYLPKADVYNTANLNSDLSTNYTGAPSWATSNGVASLYRVPGAASGSNWAATALSTWSTNKIVPTMDTLARSLSGLYNAVNGDIYGHILNYEQTKGSIGDANVPVPAQIAYTGESILKDGNQLFWLPQLEDAGDDKAGSLMDFYATNKIAPSMDELARALDGVLQTHETTTEWQEVVRFYGLPPHPLFEIAKAIEASDENAAALYKSGYLQTFAPTLEALMNESAELMQVIGNKQENLSGTSGNLVTYGATAGATGSKAIATSITNNASTVPNTAAVYNAVNARQIKIPQAGRVRDASGTLAFISDWTSASVKGTRLVTKTSSDGVVGERKIFEAGATYTNNDATNIQIATIGAVMENTVTKRCYQYRPNMPESTANCWLWEFTGNAGAAACENPVICRTDKDCCSGFGCVGDGVERVCMAVHESGNTAVTDQPAP